MIHLLGIGILAQWIIIWLLNGEKNKYKDLFHTVIKQRDTLDDLLNRIQDILEEEK